ncbi:MAG: efflux RND transporter periplasmic adaptor subunit, partial [Nitrospira sp.]
MISGARPIAGMAAALSLWACSQTQEPASSKPPVTPEHVAVESPPQSTGQIETAVVDFKPIQPELVLVGKVAYGEDRYSKISSPLQGRVVEVR